MLRYLFAALSFHCAVFAMVFLSAGGLNASLFLIGFGYLWFLQGLGHVPILIIPAVIAFACFALPLAYSAARSLAFLAFVGLFPIVVFLGLSEVVAFGAMYMSFRVLEPGACMFGTQTFTASLLDLLKNAEFLFGDTFRYQHHGHVVLPDERLMIWSYSELSFVDHVTDHNEQQSIPKKCLSILSMS